MPSHLNAVVKTTKISKALQATQGNPSHGAVTLSSQFSTVICLKHEEAIPQLEQAKKQDPNDADHNFSRGVPW